LTDDDLADRAQYLARSLTVLRPADAEFRGLLALILLTRARAAGRLDDDGSQVLLAGADRTRWDRAMIEQGLTQLRAALSTSTNTNTSTSASASASTSTGSARGPMTLQAAIAAEHAIAPSLDATDWRRVVDLYGELLVVQPTPTIALGRCVAISHLRGPAEGLADLDEVLALGGLERYPYAFGARAQMLTALRRHADAAAGWAAAARLARSTAERQYFAAQAASSGELSEAGGGGGL